MQLKKKTALKLSRWFLLPQSVIITEPMWKTNWQLKFSGMDQGKDAFSNAKVVYLIQWDEMRSKLLYQGWFNQLKRLGEKRKCPKQN